jgi:hypothetical protein
MQFPIGASTGRPDPDWRVAAPGGQRLLFATTRALAGLPNNGLIVARAAEHGRCLEVVCVGAGDVLGILAGVAARFDAELVVRHVSGRDDPAVETILRSGGAVVAGGLDTVGGPGLADATA